MGGEVLDFFHSWAGSAVSIERQPDDDDLNLPRRGDGLDALDGWSEVVRLIRHGFDRVSKDAQRVGSGNTDAGVAIVDAECWVR